MLSYSLGISQLREALVAAGRFRQALLVLAFAGTVLNVWAGVDAASRVSKGFYYVDSTLGDVTEPPENFAVNTSLNWYNEWRLALATYREQRARMWERSAKIEFAILAVAVCAWLLVPVPKTAP